MDRFIFFRIFIALLVIIFLILGFTVKPGFFVIWAIFALLAIFRLIIGCVTRKRKGKGEDVMKFNLAMTLEVDKIEFTEGNRRGRGRKKGVELPLFSFSSVSAATNNFAPTNKLGEGGFGPVYKGVLAKGDEIAVKRLSGRSGQGLEELKNEATVIAKVQHKNLVRLLGCCIEKDEKILIYEYMPNKSLDFFLFGLYISNFAFFCVVRLIGHTKLDS
ncbi:Receptor-like serine/threonine-protein kinase [Melia azedarach]|uniref:Receptor-like serine/threonine-protein kinase n=1 Tax=Melia azedarach TaxID=155640 RepID=A0ACC1Y640_MELAZ|nr:Receptor-like serine/threonine-protein kinase [Melia azedarach]